ncbi:MAG: cupin domain-containing protein [Steroidobacteraceae bacterium]
MRSRRNSAEDEIVALLLDVLGADRPLMEIPTAQRERLKSRILEEAAAAAPPLTRTVRGPGIAWATLCRGVSVGVLMQSTAENVQVALLQMEPGSKIPAHDHSKAEECFVLSGDISIGAHRVAEGDFHIADAGARHADITTASGALLLVRSEIPSVPDLN